MKLKRLATATAACGLAVGAVVAATATQGSAAPTHKAASAAGTAGCENTRVTFYPGSRLSPRYGEWNMDVLVCPTKSPSNWKTQSSIELNATANNLGMTVAEDSKLRTIETGTNKWNRFARYEATFHSQSCIPEVGWPCKSPNIWKARFTITADKKSHEVKVYRHKGSPPDSTFAIWHTP
ncbi:MULTISPECIES: hypothetical protein [Streptomyces]|uniref:hypothetical protein n=1 Tax=Streptomyces TaxID=1883 RepID=UPI0002F33B36|nr:MULTISPECIES: hypothetical protein [Streptomyces]